MQAQCYDRHTIGAEFKFKLNKNKGEIYTFRVNFALIDGLRPCLLTPQGQKAELANP